MESRWGTLKFTTTTLQPGRIYITYGEQNMNNNNNVTEPTNYGTFELFYSPRW